MIYQKSFLRETVFPFYFHLLHRSYLPSAYLISSFHCEFYENSKNNCHELSRIVTLSRCRTNLIWLETGTLPCFFYGATDGHPTTHSFLSGKKYFSEEESLAMSSHSLKGPCSIQHPFSILSPCCLFLATFSTQSPCCLPLAPSTPSTLILLPPTITTCGSCVYTPSFLPLSPFRLPLLHE